MGVEKGLHSGLRKGRGRLDYNRSDIKNNDKEMMALYIIGLLRFHSLALRLGFECILLLRFLDMWEWDVTYRT